MLTCFIGGYYGAGNIGDEAILDCMLTDLRALKSDINFIVTSWNPEQTKQDFYVEAIHWKNLSGIMDSIKKSDLVILGGGGLFQDYWGIDPKTYLRKNFRDITAYGSIPLLARLNHIPCMLYAVGIGPLKSDLSLRHTRFAVNNCDIATLRDSQSLSVLYPKDQPLPTNLEITSDPVFSLETSKTDERQIDEFISQLQLPQNSPLVGISLRFWDFSGQPQTWLSSVAAGLTSFLNSHPNHHLLLIPFQSNMESNYTNDTTIHHELGLLINNNRQVHVLPNQFTPRLTQALIKRCSLLVGMRYHSLVMGINAHIPVIALPYDPKVIFLMQEAGLEDFCCSTLNVESQELVKKMERGVADEPILARKMRTFQKKSSEAAKRNATLAINLVNSFEKSPQSLLDQLILDQVDVIREFEDSNELLSFEISQLKNQGEIIREFAENNKLLSSEISQLKNQGEIIREFAENNKLLSIEINQLKNQGEIIRDFAENNKLLSSEISKLNNQIFEKDSLLFQTNLNHTQQYNRLNDELTQTKEKLSKISQTLVTLNQGFDEQISKDNNEIKVLAHEIELSRTAIDYKISEIHTLSERNQDLEKQLNKIYLSRSWKLISAYYKLVKNFPRLYLHNKLPPKLPFLKTTGRSELQGNTETPLSSELVENKLETIIKTLNSRNLKGIFLLSSTLVFDKFNNQRVIQLARYLSKENWGVIFAAWRWSKDDAFPNFGEEVSTNIFQIPIDVLEENVSIFQNLSFGNKFFVIEFPYPPFFSICNQLKGFGFAMVYDLIDDWEEFAKVGQSIWYDKRFEQAIVLNADFLFAVSPPLAKKFINIRNDIVIIPNGFDPKILGESHKNIANRNFNPREVHIGYFGHLTEAWFDWDFLIQVIERGEHNGQFITFHIIGYGGPQDMTFLEPYSGHFYLHGPVNPTDLYQYVKQWDLAMIPFKSGKLAESVDPLKVYEYLFFGLPTIVKGINHLQGFPNLRVIYNEDEFLNAISVLKNIKQVSKNRKRLIDTFFGHSNTNDTDSQIVLTQSTWEKRFDNLLSVCLQNKWIF